MIHTVRSVGETVTSRCTKCKTVTRHVVVSLIGGEPAKVQCTVCKGFHNYRAPAPPGADPRPRKPGGGRRRPKAASAVEEEWRERVGEKSASDLVPYAMDAVFRTGDLIDHPSFGVGWVRKAVPPNTVEVLFKDSIRRLRCRM